MKQIVVKCQGADTKEVDELITFQGNLKTISKKNLEKLIKAILIHGFCAPIFIWKNGKKFFILDGHQRLKALEALKDQGYTIPPLPVDFIYAANKKEAKEKLLHITSQFGDFDKTGLDDFLLEADIDLTELETIRFACKDFVLSEVSPEVKEDKAKLSDKLIVPPFSVFDTRQEYWESRKRLWLELGIRSEESRENITVINSLTGEMYDEKKKIEKELGKKLTEKEYYENYRTVNAVPKVSIFDPVLCEIIYTWFNVPGGTVLDSFAGGSVRGIVAQKLGFPYTGIELREEQVSANQEQAKEILKRKTKPRWITGDSDVVLDTIDSQFDLFFTCPPYGSLEKYSDSPADLSNMAHPQFLKTYERIIKKSCSKIKENRFACIVIGDFRDKKGFYRQFVSTTEKLFIESGFKLYNEIIFLNKVVSLAVRAERAFQKSRKVGKCHQNILVFYKGDPKAIHQDFPQINVQADGRLSE